MSSALSGPLLAAAGVLCVSGAAKLKAPRGAISALALLGLPADVAVARAIALAELTLGFVTLIAPSTASALILAGAYAAFASRPPDWSRCKPRAAVSANPEPPPRPCRPW